MYGCLQPFLWNNWYHGCDTNFSQSTKFENLDTKIFSILIRNGILNCWECYIAEAPVCSNRPLWKMENTLRANYLFHFYLFVCFLFCLTFSSFESRLAKCHSKQTVFEQYFRVAHSLCLFLIGVCMTVFRISLLSMRCVYVPSFISSSPAVQFPFNKKRRLVWNDCWFFLLPSLFLFFPFVRSVSEFSLGFWGETRLTVQSLLRKRDFTW